MKCLDLEALLPVSGAAATGSTLQGRGCDGEAGGALKWGLQVTWVTVAFSVSSQTLLSADHIVIATGGRPRYPTHVSVLRSPQPPTPFMVW